MDNQFLVWIILLPILIMSLAPFLFARKDPARQKALDRYARRMDLAITDDVRPMVIDRIRTHEKFGLIGTALGTGVALVLALLLWPVFAPSAADREFPLPLLAVSCIAIGAAYAPSFAAARRTLRAGPGPRIARSRVPEFADYVPAFERIAAPVSVAVAVLALVTAPLLFATGLLESDGFHLVPFLVAPGGILTLVGAASWLIGVRVRRAVLDTGQPAASEQELAWDDALRSQVLRDITSMPTFVSLFGALMLLFAVISSAAPPSTFMAILGAVVLFGLFAGIILVTVLVVSASASRHFHRRLWSDRASA